MYVIISLSLISCRRTSPLVKTEFLLGTPISISIFEGGNNKVLEDIFEAVQNIEQTMSVSTKDYDSTILLDINKQSKTLHRAEYQEYVIPHDIAHVIEKSLYVSSITQGAFDISIYPLVALWGWGSGSEQVPKPEEIKEKLSLVNWKQLSVNKEGSLAMLRLGGQQAIDVGGIAKGYAADLAKNMLIERGVTSAILDFGGNIVTVGQKQDGTLWNIGIQEPFEQTGSAVAVLQTEETSVVTSGIYERYFEEHGVLYSHLIDPSTGYPIDNELVSVSIIHKESIIADGLSTAVFILGFKEGLALVETLPSVEALFITNDNNIYISSGLDNSVEVLNSKYQLR